MIPAPGDLIVPVAMVIVVSPMGTTRQPSFREWSVHEPAIVTAVTRGRWGGMVVTLSIVKTKLLWTMSLSEDAARPDVRVLAAATKRGGAP